MLKSIIFTVFFLILIMSCASPSYTPPPSIKPKNNYYSNKHYPSDRHYSSGYIDPFDVRDLSMTIPYFDNSTNIDVNGLMNGNFTMESPEKLKKSRISSKELVELIRQFFPDENIKIYEFNGRMLIVDNYK